MRRASFVILTVGLVLAIFGITSCALAVGILPYTTGGIVNGERFIDVLEMENIEMTAWLNGHTHFDHCLPDTSVDRWGVTFIDDGSIRENPESLFLVFENGKSKVKVKSRNHEKPRWNELENKFSFYLDFPFRCPLLWGKENLIVWVWSDFQPTTEVQWDSLEKTVEDVNKLSMKPDMSLVLGDLVSHGARENYSRLKNYLDNNSYLPLENFYELAGNHDFYPSSGDHSNYRSIMEPRLRYTIRRGNVLFILLSDEKPGVSGYITENTFQWWRNTVEKNQKSTNIITLTHHPLGSTGLSIPGQLRFLKKNPLFSLAIIIPLIISAIIAYEAS